MIDKLKRDRWYEEAIRRIPSIIRGRKVVTDREIKVQLEDGPFPWVTHQALSDLVDRGVVKPHGYRGRRRVGKFGEVERFYSLAGTSYKEIEDLIQKKRIVTALVNSNLMGTSPVGYHAQYLFRDAFEKPF